MDALKQQTLEALVFDLAYTGTPLTELVGRARLLLGSVPAPRKVFVALAVDEPDRESYTGETICAVFSTREAADLWVEQDGDEEGGGHQEAWVEEHTLDAGTGCAPQTRLESHCEQVARRAGWTTIEEFGWNGNLICHKDHGEDRNGNEYGSWLDCCAAEQLLPIPKAHASVI